MTVTTEQVMDLPTGWSLVRLAEVGSFLSGSGFPLVYQGNTSGDYPFFKVSDFSNSGNERTLNRANHYIGESTRKKMGARLFPKGAIAFAKIGAAIFLERKRIIDQASCLDNNMAAFVLSAPEISRELILAHLQSFSLGSLVSSTALPAISSTDLKSIAFRLPDDPKEQEAIAEALSDTDALIEGLERLIAKKRLIKQGAMQDLLTAKRRLPGFSGEWQVKKLAEVGQVKTGLTYNPKNVSPYGTLVLRSSNIQDDRLAFLDNVFVDVDVSDEATVRVGDLLICVRNGSRQLIGKTAMIDKRADGMAFGAFMSAYRSELKDYLIWCFQSSVVQKQVAEHLGATINQITNKTLKAIEVPIPTQEEERHAIANVLTDMDAEIQALETRLEKARQVKEGMMQNLLTGRIRLV
jgi:type I restriction enzyme S subunit